MLAGLPLALVAAWVFHQLVERPSHRLAKRIAARPT
jgi:peptidoglycan/LPS O-acetylase OafA/YrhL